MAAINESELKNMFSEAERLARLGQNHKAQQKYTNVINYCISLIDSDRTGTAKKNWLHILCDSYNNRGHLKYLAVEFSDAIDDFTAAVDTNDNMAPAFYNRGLVHYRMGRFNDAIEDMVEALKRDSQAALKNSAEQCLLQSYRSSVEFVESIEVDSDEDVVVSGGDVIASGGDIRGEVESSGHSEREEQPYPQQSVAPSSSLVATSASSNQPPITFTSHFQPQGGHLRHQIIARHMQQCQHELNAAQLQPQSQQHEPSEQLAAWQQCVQLGKQALSTTERDNETPNTNQLAEQQQHPVQLCDQKGNTNSPRPQIQTKTIQQLVEPPNISQLGEDEEGAVVVEPAAAPAAPAERQPYNHLPHVEQAHCVGKQNHLRELLSIGQPALHYHHQPQQPQQRPPEPEPQPSGAQQQRDGQSPDNLLVSAQRGVGESGRPNDEVAGEQLPQQNGIGDNMEPGDNLGALVEEELEEQVATHPPLNEQLHPHIIQQLNSEPLSNPANHPAADGQQVDAEPSQHVERSDDEPHSTID